MIWPSSSARSEERAPWRTPGRPVPRLAAPAASTPIEPHARVVQEAGEHPDRVRAAADAGDRRIGQPALGLEDLRPRLAADHRLELADDLGVGLRADARADQVVRRLDVRDPVADRLAGRLLQRLRPELDRPDLGAEQAHPLDVRTLAAHVLGAHVDDALEPEAGAHRRRRHPMLAGARLGDDPLLPEALREHRLTERVVQLVRAGVEQVLPLEVEALAGGEALGKRQGRRAARVLAAEPVELRANAWSSWPRASRRRARRAPGSASPGRTVRRSSP